MKKLLSISLAVLLMVSTIGITVHKHYCENELISVSLFPHGERNTCDSNMPMKDRNCSDQHQLFNVNSPIVIVALNFELDPSFDWLNPSFFLISRVSHLKITRTPKFYADANPPPSEPNIYTKVQSFLL